MSTINHCQKKILSLGSLLDKLFKVINHSDPTAENIKHLLYKKYKTRLSLLTTEFKTKYEWSRIRTFIIELADDNRFSIDKDAQRVIVNKLLSDIENGYIERHVLSELTPPKSKEIEKKLRVRTIRKQIMKNRKQSRRQFDLGNMEEMIQYRDHQRAGRDNLSKLIKAIKRGQTDTTT